MKLQLPCILTSPSQVHKQRLLLPCIITSPLPGTQTETPVTLYSHLPLPSPKYTNRDSCYPVFSPPPPPRYTNRDSCYPVFSPPPSQVHKQRLQLPCILTSPLLGTQTETPVTLYSHLPPPRYTNRDSCYPVFSPPPPRYTNRDACYPVFSPPPPRYTNRDACYPVFSPPPS